MLVQSGGRGAGVQVLAALAALLAGCSSLAPRDVPPPPVAKSYHSMPGASLPLQRESVATTLAEYRQEFARLLHAANPGLVYDGPPPNPVRGVIVMRAEIDAIGGMRRLELYRGAGHAPWLEQLVAQTVRQAEPFPRPSMKLLNGSRSVAFTETWLFDYEGRFRLRTLSAAQADPPPEDTEEAPR